MSSLPPLRLGVAGLGVVGAGVVKLVQTHADALAARAGRPIVVSAVSARTRGQDRGVDLSSCGWEDNPVDLAARADVDLVIEVIGGSDGPAKATVEAALGRAKPVVTANKALIATHGGALAAQAETNGATLRFEAAVAGGIPVVKALREGLAANAVTRIYGVMNGTSNYILTEMERTGRDYADILADAQRLGYAEADPTADVGGDDAAQKLAILAAIAFGGAPDLAATQVSGIEHVSLADIHTAVDLGYRIKLLAFAQRGANYGVEQRVSACLVPASDAVGALEGVTNAVVIEGDFVGRTLYEGPGAGAGPTASAIVADVIDIARGAGGATFGVPHDQLTSTPQRPTDQQESEFYLRLTLADEPGALAQAALALGEEGVSIDHMKQYEAAENGAATVAIVTHMTCVAAMTRALTRLDALSAARAPAAALRVASELAG